MVGAIVFLLCYIRVIRTAIGEIRHVLRTFSYSPIEDRFSTTNAHELTRICALFLSVHWCSFVVRSSVAVERRWAMRGRNSVSLPAVLTLVTFLALLNFATDEDRARHQSCSIW